MLTTGDYLFAETVYVAFRTINPDEGTVAEVQQMLLEHNIDSTQLYVVTTDHCQ